MEIDLLSAGRSGLLQSSEEVFLAQLHRRALLCNQGFQGLILQILNRHTSNATGVRGGAGGCESIPQQFDIESRLIFRSNSEFNAGSFRESYLSNFGGSRKRSSVESLQRSSSTSSESSWRKMEPAVVSLQCTFSDRVEAVEVQQAPVKT